MELIEALDATFEHTHAVIAQVRADQLGVPTPCRDWDVQTLLAHMIGAVSAIGASAAGQPAGASGALALSDDPAAQFRATADATLAVWQTPGALDRVVKGPGGPMPARALAGINLLDTATHSWDIAMATGQDPSLPDPVARLALEVAPEIVTPALRSGRFDPEVPVDADASPTDRLVAFLGRTP